MRIFAVVVTVEIVFVIDSVTITCRQKYFWCLLLARQQCPRINHLRGLATTLPVYCSAQVTRFLHCPTVSLNKKRDGYTTIQSRLTSAL